MKRIPTATLITGVALLLGSWAGAKDKTPVHRPKILGIWGVHFYTSDLPAARIFYSHVLGQDLECRMCEERAADPIFVRLPSGQFLSVTPTADKQTNNFLADVVFATDDIKALGKYLKASGIAVDSRNSLPDPKFPGFGGPPPNSKKGKEPDCALCGLTVTDPEGHRLGFVQAGKLWAAPNTDALRIIHAGIIINDRAGADHFYKDILGFHLYWHGGMKEDVD